MRIGKPIKNAHSDGTDCLEGTQDVPEGFIPCCERFEHSTKSCTYDLRFEWWEKNNGWFMMCENGCGMLIDYCPYCGANIGGNAKSENTGRFLKI